MTRRRNGPEFGGFVPILGTLTLAFFAEPALCQHAAPPSHRYIAVEDSIRLSTDLYLPPEAGRYPCILVRTPYDKKALEFLGRRYAQQAYAVVIQDTRGRYDSTGRFYPFRHEREDGLATVRWIKNQPWFGGKIGGWGASYLGYTQWVLSDRLDAICPSVTSDDMYDCFYPGGLFSLQLAVRWGMTNGRKRASETTSEAVAETVRIFPVEAIADSIAQDCPFFEDWVMHPRRDEYWRTMAFPGPPRGAVLSIAGWYDIFLRPQIQDFQTVHTFSSEPHFFVIGPWAHGTVSATDVDFSDASGFPHVDAVVDRFYARHLKGEDVPVFSAPFSEARYNLFIMHRNAWMGFRKWPPENARFTPFFLNDGSGITLEAPESEGSVSFVYDPEDPYPSLGGTDFGPGVGPAWQNPNLGRGDCAAFQSEPLPSSSVIAGPMFAALFVNSDAPATDFYVCLEDVYPDGRILNIQEGGATVDFGDTIRDDARRVQIDLWATGYEIQAGHRLRVVVTSSLFPRYDRNPNTGPPSQSRTDTRRANQTVFFGPERRSCVYLPILSGVGE